MATLQYKSGLRFIFAVWEVHQIKYLPPTAVYALSCLLPVHVYKSDTCIVIVRLTVLIRYPYRDIGIIRDGKENKRAH